MERLVVRGEVGTVLHRGMKTGISEASKRVSIFSFPTQGGKQASFYFRQGNSDKDTIKVYGRYRPTMADICQHWPISADIGRWSGHVRGQVRQILPLGSSHRLHPPVWACRQVSLLARTDLQLTSSRGSAEPLSLRGEVAHTGKATRTQASQFLFI